jgi:hypothetical protein
VEETTMRWQTVWSGDVGERHVEVRVWPTGEIRVNTARLRGDAASTVGRPITVHADRHADLEKVLIAEGEFTREEAKEILSHLPQKGS